MPQVSVAELFKDNQEALKLSWLVGEPWATATLDTRRINQSNEGLIGHLNFYHPNWIQIFSRTEATYFRSMDESAREQALSRLYALGLGATRVPWLKRRYVGPRSDWARGQIERRLASAVLLARVIPGLRLATYTACGFVRVPFAPFSAWVLLAVALWTLGLYAVSAAVGRQLSHHLGLPPALAVALPILVLAAAVPLARHAHRRLRGATP